MFKIVFYIKLIKKAILTLLVNCKMFKVNFYTLNHCYNLIMIILLSTNLKI